MLEPADEELEQRSFCIVLIRYIFFVFLAGTFFYILPDKAQPHIPAAYNPVLTLLDSEHFHPRRCIPVTSAKYEKFAENLVTLARENSFPVLTAAHVGDKGCLLVTNLLNSENRYDVLLNPGIVSLDGPHFAKIKSILCKRVTQRKKLYTRIRFTYQNFTEPRMDYSRSSPTPDCTAQLFQAFEILNGTFRCY
jgi:hypothetical protein